ncbi:hypothetical protein BDF20DRAFT_896729 [Mycotypha africana]|uniref:uncharacterized protein n=1 Tax=Mycotypha africana TaxID=64632 RepID=UPI0023008D28|nr:uncharacterized protein BDF20DRAFT_896729 [Mycotypha africana]KAI8968498.1 hypothetical protein BDF20DRAFT_896729 [Mycotypha africana]
MAIEEKKRKHKSKSDKSSKKKHKSSKATEISPSAVTTTADSTSPAPATTISSTEPTSCFSEVVVQLYLHLAPMWSGKTMEGVNEQLNAFLMKYVPEVDGIVLAHSNVEFLTQKGKVLYDSPFCHFFISVKFLVWKPKKGTKLVGRINLQSEDHIGLLIYGTFNASIPRAFIPVSEYEWKVNEEEAATEDKDDEEEEEEEEEEKTTADDADSNGATTRQRTQYGEWVNKITGTSIGGEDGTLEFTVVDIIEANDILNVTGSL